MRSLIVWFALVAAVWAEKISYKGYKVYRVYVENDNQVKALAGLKGIEDIDFWSPLRLAEKPIDVMVSPQGQEKFVWFLNVNQLHQYQILIDDVEQIIQRERMMQLTQPRLTKGGISFTKFNTHAEINSYIDELAQSYPNFVQVESAGKSYEGRDLKVAKISTDPSANKPIIFVDGGIHAREWAAPAQATYIINQLVENSANAKLLEKVDWHILPVVNPDGYEYTQTNDRFWRKTRSRGNRCYGTDANRNFGFHWGEIGASSNECSETFKGKSAFSEKESEAVRDYIFKYKSNVKLYLTFHSYGEYLLFPWGYTSHLPDDYDELQALGEMVANTIKQVRGTIYSVGTSTTLLYAAAGGSDDWAKGVAGVELSYTIELPGGQGWGFDPPPSQILPIVTETWEGIKAYHHYVQTKFN